MEVDLKPLKPPTIIKGFDEARRKLVEALGALTFVKICVMTFPENNVRAGTHFQGEAIEVFPGRHHGHARTCFFSRFGRGFGTSQILGSFSLIDCPFDTSHPTAVPQIGDILVGSLSPAKKGKIPFELRGWSNNAKPLLELARVLQYGTRMGENELKNLLKQPASSSAAMYLRLNPNMNVVQKMNAQKSTEAADDLWCLARIVCFKKLDEDKTLKLSKPYVELVDALVIKYGDEEFLEEWSKVRPETEYVPEAYNPTGYGGYGAPYAVTGASFLPPSFVPPTGASMQARTPEYPSSPASSPYPPSSPKYTPSSPKYTPSSPKYAPSSPTPSSPKSQSPDPLIEDTKKRVPQLSLYDDL